MEPFRTRPLIIDSHGLLRERDTGRVFQMNGINFASNTKLPRHPVQETHMTPEDCGLYEDADVISFVGKPFPLHEAYEHLSRIKQCGYNTIRFVTTWEALEHNGPGVYDVDYADYVVDFLKAVDEVGGLYVFIDPHQDVWSRFTGGSGAPIWTLYAAGLEPCNFEATYAAKIHHLASDPEKFTKMVWTTNYNKLASEVMFTSFFSGSIFTPKAMIDGKNIQDFLQDHFIAAFSFLMQYIKSQIPHVYDTCLLGIESLNEPNNGLYGFGNLNKCPSEQKLKLDETPTPIQTFRLGMGYPEELDMYTLSIFGPSKNGTKWVDPCGRKAWVTEENNKDKHYGFKRSPEWKLGECLFAQHGVWNSNTGKLIRPDYFQVHPQTGEYFNETTFINGPFLNFWSKFRREMRKIDEHMFLIIQPPVLQIPPRIANNPEYVDNKTMVALHYYDGMSLMFQKWNRLFNVDTLGIMRGRYLNPVFGIVFGEANIRKSIGKQLKHMATESYKNAGYDVPVVFTETGMPFNMDNKYAYRSGNYDSQEAANDAILSGLESEQLNFTYWCYNPDNCHAWGDLWNLEDFSIWSNDDSNEKAFELGGSYEEWLFKNSSSSDLNAKSFLPKTGTSNDSDNDNNSSQSDSGESISKGLLRATTKKYIDSEMEYLDLDLNMDLTSGLRAVDAIIRPVPYLVNGVVKVCKFDVATKSFHLEIASARPKMEIYPDVIIIPKHHYHRNNFRVYVSAGRFVIKSNSLLQWIEWDHSEASRALVTLDVVVPEALQSKDELSCGGCSSLKGLACGCL